MTPSQHHQTSLTGISGTHLISQAEWFNGKYRYVDYEDQNLAYFECETVPKRGATKNVQTQNLTLVRSLVGYLLSKPTDQPLKDQLARILQTLVDQNIVELNVRTTVMVADAYKEPLLPILVNDKHPTMIQLEDLVNGKAVEKLDVDFVRDLNERSERIWREEFDLSQEPVLSKWIQTHVDGVPLQKIPVASKTLLEACTIDLVLERNGVLYAGNLIRSNTIGERIKQVFKPKQVEEGSHYVLEDKSFTYPEFETFEDCQAILLKHTVHAILLHAANVMDVNSAPESYVLFICPTPDANKPPMILEVNMVTTHVDGVPLYRLVLDRLTFDSL